MTDPWADFAGHPSIGQVRPEPGEECHLWGCVSGTIYGPDYEQCQCWCHDDEQEHPDD